MNISLNNKTVTLRDNLFWDIPKDKIDPLKNAPLIVERVLTRGDKNEFADVVNFYGENFFINIAMKLKTLDRKTVNFLSAVFRLKRKVLHATTTDSRSFYF
ncbi:MAG: hypothetical protein HC830_06995 [Bacteroidetes bacterium]|nr:hypothetical protein [Bacteroidota bacterium]